MTDSTSIAWSSSPTLDDCFNALAPFLPTSSNPNGVLSTDQKSAILTMALDMFKRMNAFDSPNAFDNSSSSTHQQRTISNTHLQNLGGFFVVLTEAGVIVYVSENVSKQTPFTQQQVIGSSIYDFAVEGDHKKIGTFLSRKKSKIPPRGCKDRTYPMHGERLFFHFRLKMKADFNHVNLMGHYRQIGHSKVGMDPSEASYVFIGLIRPVLDRPITELSLMESIQDQYITRHLPNGKIIFADHRISTACGYLPSEVVGLSGFYFIHGEDLAWSAMANRQMLSGATGEGCSTYRLRCKDNSYIMVQTTGYIEMNRHTETVESFLCINTVIKEQDGLRLIDEQKEEYSPYVFRFNELLKEENIDLPSFPLFGTTFDDVLESCSCPAEPSSRKRKTKSQGGTKVRDKAKSGCKIHNAITKRRRIAAPCANFDDGGYVRGDPRYRMVDGNRVIDLHPQDTSHMDILSQVSVARHQDQLSAKRQVEALLNFMSEPDPLNVPVSRHKKYFSAT